MTRVLKSKFKVSRRVGVSVYGSEKDAVHKKKYRPGQHGASPIKLSTYGKQLVAKQKLRGHYGYISERQFSNMFNEAKKRRGNTEENFVGMLESRIDVAVFRLKLAKTIFAARQMVSHKHFLVNGNSVNISSYRLKPGDVVSLREKSKGLGIVASSISTEARSVPSYYSFDDDSMSGTFVRIPHMDEIPYPFVPEFGRILEFYSR